MGRGSRLSSSVVCLLASCLFAVALPAAAKEAAEPLERARQVTGGDAWNGIRSSHSRVKVVTGGLTGVAESWDDVLTGRYLDRYELGPASGAQGFDGAIVWSQDSSKQVHAEEGGDEREAAANEAYRRSLSYWFPARRAATVERSADQAEGGRRLQVVRITPQGGRPFDVWIDAATGLFDRIVEKGALETRTTYFSDYREIAGVKVPFASRSTNGDTKYDQTLTVEVIEFNVPTEEAQYRMPQPPPPDFAIAGGAASTTVPFDLLNNHMYVQVHLNGHGPFRLLCDTGGANVVTPEVAKELGLKTEGALQGRGVGEKSEDFALTKVDTIKIGDATIADQVFVVFDLAAFAAVEGLPQSGLIGYEVFKRFTTRIDYEKSRITLMLPSASKPAGGGVVVPFKFNGHIPQVEGEIDGIPGKFDIDTGSRGALSLLRPFWEKHDLKGRLGAGVEAVTGWGVGGAAHGLLARPGILRLGGVTIERPVTALSLQTKGAFTDPYVAGNVGAEILKRFNVTFDYARQEITFEPNANHADPFVYDRSGLWLNQAAGSFEVLDVIPGSPAAGAGIKVGDRVLEIDGRGAGEIPLAEARRILRTLPPGTKVRLAVRSGDRDRRVVLKLKDLL